MTYDQKIRVSKEELIDLILTRIEAVKEKLINLPIKYPPPKDLFPFDSHKPYPR